MTTDKDGTPEKDTTPGPIPSAQPHQERPQQMILQAPTLENLTAYLAAMNMPGVFNQDAPFMMVPNDIKAVSVEAHMPRPARMRKNVVFTEADSFIDYFGAFKTNSFPRIFVMGDDAGMKFMSVFDYAIPPGADTQAVVTPMWGEHRSYLELAYHPDFAVLRKANNTWMSQFDFALFVEEITYLFSNPDGATMLELAQELKGHRNVGWQSGKRLSNNQVKLEYTEQVEARSTRGDIIVPEYLEFETPIFKGFQTQTFRAAFSWKMEGEKVLFSYRLLTRIAERNAVDEVKAKIATETLMPIYSVKDFRGIALQYNSPNGYDD